MTTENRQGQYFENVNYRGPQHPVVQAYVRPKWKYIVDNVPLLPEWKILDLGCGNGIFTQPIAQSYPDVVGLDYSSHLLEENPHRTLVRGDATTLPFPDRSFDLAFEGNLLHHVSDRTGVIAEMSRVSRGYVVLLEPNRYNPLMFGLSLVVAAERGVLKSSVKRLSKEIRDCGLKLQSVLTTGMISQNNTPAFLIPLLQHFDRQTFWGEYIVMIAKKST